MNQPAGRLPVIDRAALLDELTARAKAYVDERLAGLCVLGEAPPEETASGKPSGRGPLVPVSFGTLGDPSHDQRRNGADQHPPKADAPAAPQFRPRQGAAGTISLRLTPSGQFALATFKSGKGDPDRIVPIPTIEAFRTLVDEYSRRFWAFDLEGDLAVFADWLRRRMTTPPPIEPPARESDVGRPAGRRAEAFQEIEEEETGDDEPETLTPEVAEVRDAK